MMSLDDLVKKVKGRKLKIFENMKLKTDRDLTEKLTICIPDMHILERGPNDDFINGNPKHEKRFLSLLDFILELREKEGDNVEIIQLGDMFDLWQAKWNTNMIVSAYPNIIGLLEKINPIYVVGNHDIDLVKWYEKKGETFKRRWRHYSSVDGKLTAIYEHGFQADAANNQESWTGVIGRGITKIVGMAEYIYPDIDVVLGSVWDSIIGAFSKYNVFTPVRDPQSFNQHEYLNYYINLLNKYNRGETDDHLGIGDIDLALAVVAHTHKARLVQRPQDGRSYYLLDCGSWVNGGHEVGIISGKDLAVFQWG